MTNRRRFLASILSAAALLMWPGLVSVPAHAQAGGPAAAAQFVANAGQQLVDVVNGGDSDAQKKLALQRIVDQVVDVDDVGRFCLGRFWRTATLTQRQDYMHLFHAVLMNNITSKLGEFRGISFRLTRTVPRGADEAVGTIITRPNNAPNNVQWVVSFHGGGPKIVDVIAEGTSLRLTQRSDYMSYLGRNNNDVNALIAAMRRQVGG